MATKCHPFQRFSLCVANLAGVQTNYALIEQLMAASGIDYEKAEAIHKVLCFCGAVLWLE